MSADKMTNLLRTLLAIGSCLALGALVLIALSGGF